MSETADRLSDGQLSANRWQTAGRLGGVALAAVVGRWFTGPTFGYTLFALIWTPIAAVYSVQMACDMSNTCRTDAGRLHEFGGPVVARYAPLRRHKPSFECWVRWLTIMAAVAIMALPWLTIEPIVTAGRLSLILLAVTVAAVASRDLLAVLLIGPSTAKAVATLAWLAWVILPLTMTRQWIVLIGDSAVAKVLPVHPLLAANAVSATAGDWTHQALAYQYLTKLGQDVPFDWPPSIWASFALHIGAMTILLLLRWWISLQIVPRGTIQSYSLESSMPHRRTSSSNSSNDL